MIIYEVARQDSLYVLCDKCSVKDQQPSALAACGVVLMLGHARPGFQRGMFFRCLLGSKNNDSGLGEIRLLGLLHLGQNFFIPLQEGRVRLVVVLEFKMPSLVGNLAAQDTALEVS